jgi:Txe/YoeB family toxin of Txe-Axe toxin-antitoxin module
VKNLVFSCLLAFLLVSCGSDAIITSDDSKKNIDGRAVDGYLQKSTVCLDLDLDGYCNIGTEPATSTKDDGSYTLALEAKHTSHINFKKAPILVYDGKDADSGQRFTGKLQAPNNGENIIVSPVTTLVHKAIKEDLDAGVISEEDIVAKIEEKKEKLRLALKIPKGTDLLADPVELHKAGQSSLINANISIHQTAKALKSNSTSGDKSEDEMVEDIYKVFAKSLNNLTTSELNEHSLDASSNRLNVVVNKAKTLSQSNQEVAQLFPKEEQKALDAIDSMLKNIEKRFENANNDEESLKKIVALVEEDRLKIEKEFENLAEDENFSKDIISVIDDDSLQLDESSDTWKVDALQRFLEKELFIDSNLTKDFALVLYSANIQPWEIENKIEKIKDTNTTVYKKIVNAIEEIKVTKQN